MSLRKRILSSPGFNRAVAGIVRVWLQLVWRTTRREMDGWDKVAELIDRHGAVIIVGWHQYIMMSPWMFDLTKGPCRSLTSTGRAGRLAGWLHRVYGYETIAMPKGVLGAAEMRLVLKGLKQGVSICISPDGPRGPARQAKVTPIQWARASQVPVVCFTYAASKAWTLGTWDNQLVPKPFGRMVLMWRVWERDVPARCTADETEALAVELGAFMDGVSTEAEALL